MLDMLTTAAAVDRYIELITDARCSCETLLLGEDL